MSDIKAIYARTQFWFGLSSGGSVGHTLGVLKGLKNNKVDLKILGNEAFYGIEDFDHEILEPLKKQPQWFGELLYNLTAFNWYSKKVKEYQHLTFDIITAGISCESMLLVFHVLFSNVFDQGI